MLKQAFFLAIASKALVSLTDEEEKLLSGKPHSNFVPQNRVVSGEETRKNLDINVILTWIDSVIQANEHIAHLARVQRAHL